MFLVTQIILEDGRSSNSLTLSSYEGLSVVMFPFFSFNRVFMVVCIYAAGVFCQGVRVLHVASFVQGLNLAGRLVRTQYTYASRVLSTSWLHILPHIEYPPVGRLQPGLPTHGRQRALRWDADAGLPIQLSFRSQPRRGIWISALGVSEKAVAVQSAEAASVTSSRASTNSSRSRCSSSGSEETLLKQPRRWRVTTCSSHFLIRTSFG